MAGHAPTRHRSAQAIVFRLAPKPVLAKIEGLWRLDASLLGLDLLGLLLFPPNLNFISAFFSGPQSFQVALFGGKTKPAVALRIFHLEMLLLLSAIYLYRSE